MKFQQSANELPNVTFRCHKYSYSKTDNELTIAWDIS